MDKPNNEQVGGRRKYSEKEVEKMLQSALNYIFMLYQQTT
jgi:hypothetical protein